MKKVASIILLVLVPVSFIYAQVSINDDGSNPDESSILEAKSTSKGFLPPRLSEVQMNGINNPTEGLMVYCSDCDPKGPYYFNGSIWVSFSSNTLSFSNVISPASGKKWMDRNLGATRVATSKDDQQAYGYLYQWGRGTDGHQERNSSITNTLSMESDTPGHGNFIATGHSEYVDWRMPQNDDLWQGVSGINNPCPNGYRLPTKTEWEAEITAWTGTVTADVAFGSFLKLPCGGKRNGISGQLEVDGSESYYWTSTSVYGPTYHESELVIFGSEESLISNFGRAFGTSVRCIKD